MAVISNFTDTDALVIRVFIKKMLKLDMIEDSDADEAFFLVLDRHTSNRPFATFPVFGVR